MLLLNKKQIRAMRVVVLVMVVMFFAIAVVQGVLLPWSTKRQQERAGGQNNFLSNGKNILRSISFKLNKIFSPWSEDVRRNSMEDRR